MSLFRPDRSVIIPRGNALAFAALAGLGLALVAVGCSGDDDEKPAGTGGSAGSAGAAGSAGSGGNAGASGSGGSAGADASACVQDQATAQECIEASTTPCQEVTLCACNSCACELEACRADPGCTAIRACAAEKRCNGAGCALPEFCGPVVDMYGGLTGPSASLGLKISNCLGMASCAPHCPLADAGTDAEAGAGGSAGAGAGGTAGNTSGGAGAGGAAGATAGGAGGAATGGSAGTGGTGGAAAGGRGGTGGAATGGRAGTAGTGVE